MALSNSWRNFQSIGKSVSRKFKHMITCKHNISCYRFHQQPAASYIHVIDSLKMIVFVLVSSYLFFFFSFCFSRGTTSPPSSPAPSDKPKSFDYTTQSTPEKSASETRGSRASSPPASKSGRTSGDSHKSKSGATSPGSTGRAGSPVGAEPKSQPETAKEFMERVQASLHERVEASAAKLSSVNIYQCNCWCQGWAEVSMWDSC